VLSPFLASPTVKGQKPSSCFSVPLLQKMRPIILLCIIRHVMTSLLSVLWDVLSFLGESVEVSSCVLGILSGRFGVGLEEVLLV